MPVATDLDEGNALDARLRPGLEALFGRDFSRIRVHTDSQASTSAGGVGATAYTFGRHIVFGADRYQPYTAPGQALLVHELVHAVQQDMAEPSPPNWGRVLTADHAAEQEARGVPLGGWTDGITVRERATPALALQDEAASTSTPVAEEGSGSSAMDSLIERASIAAAGALRHSLPVPVPETVLAGLIAAEAAFIEHGFRRLVARGELLAILGRVRELASGSVAAEFAARYIWGVLKGLASPISGLIQLAVSGVQLVSAAGSWALEHLHGVPDVGAEAEALAAEFDHFAGIARANLQSLRSRDGALAFASAVFSAAETLGSAIEHQIVGMARERGRHAADSLIDELRNRPLPQLAESAGEIVGTVIIEVVLLVFSDGIGNLIAKLGEFTRALRPLSRGVGAFADVIVGVGRIIAELEHIVGRLLQKTVLRPLMPLIEALEPLLARVRRFVRRLIGLSEEAASGLGRAGARALTQGESRTARAAQGAGVPPPVSARSIRPPVADLPPSSAAGRARGATAEGVGEGFHYEYHPAQRPPAIEHAPTRTHVGTRRAAGPSEATLEPTGREQGSALELDEETRRTLSGSRTVEEEIAADPEELRELSLRFEGDRFDPSMTEEDLPLFAQEHFPEHVHDPAKRGREVFAGGRPVRRQRLGSSRPDLYIRTPRRRPISLEAKNVFVSEPEEWDLFILRTVRQAEQRAAALPRTARQHIVIDFRGQDVTREFAAGLRRELAARSNGLIRPRRIHFLPPSLD